MYNIKIEEINLNNNRIIIEKFLSLFNLTLDKDVDCTIVAKYNDDIIGTCSYSGHVLKCFAVKNEFRGIGIASKLITYITNILFEKGIYNTFVFTKKENIQIFENLGYKQVYSTNDISLLENGITYVDEYIKNMFNKSKLSNNKKASIVMNCNPITLGHMYLIERASKENEEVVVFIVEEDKSLFPFDVRFDLVKKCTKDLKNVHILPGGKYIISSNTFPSYFLRDEEKTAEYIKIDLGIFGKYIKSVFNINKRYVGTEPYCKVTKKYNEGMKNILSQFNIEIVEVDRLQYNNKKISASEVRQLIKEDKFNKIKEIVCKDVYKYLISEDAKNIIENIKRSDSLH